MQVVIIELPKIYSQKRKKEDKLLEWLYFLVNPKSEEVKEIMEKNEGIKEANKRLEEISQDEIMQRINDWKIMGEYNEAMERKKAKKEGEKIGEAKGRKKEQKEIAKKLKEEKVPIEIIIKTTGLSKTEIEEI